MRIQCLSTSDQNLGGDCVGTWRVECSARPQSQNDVLCWGPYLFRRAGQAMFGKFSYPSNVPLQPIEKEVAKLLLAANYVAEQALSVTLLPANKKPPRD